MQSKTILIALCHELPITTDGTVNPVYTDLPVPSERIRSLLPYAVSLTLYSLTQGMPGTNDAEWNAVFRSGFNRDHETTDANKLEPGVNQINANGSKRHAAFTDLSKFLLESRLQLSAQNKTGVSGQRTVLVSAVLAVETVGM